MGRCRVAHAIDRRRDVAVLAGAALRLRMRLGWKGRGEPEALDELWGDVVATRFGSWATRNGGYY